MDVILEGFRKAVWLLVTFDPEVMGITLLSLKVSGIATLISLIAACQAAPPSRFPVFRAENSHGPR